VLKDRTPLPRTGPPSQPFADDGGFIAAAHRGGAAEAEAGSARAVSLTADLGFHLEADVSVTADGVPVVFHPTGPARLMTWRTLPFDAGARSLYRLDDLLAEHPALRVLIDVKQWPAVAPTAIAIARAGAAERVSIGTFSQARTDATAQAIYELTGFRPWTALGLRRLVRMALGHAPRAGGRHTAQLPHRLVTRWLVVRAHAARVKVIAWTVNDEATMHRLLDMGVDGMITDHPSRLRRVLTERDMP
jgi:glycerophosphoryl diester phosphodiesterase